MQAEYIIPNNNPQLYVPPIIGFLCKIIDEFLGM